MGKDVLRGMAAVAAGTALCTLGVTAVGVTTGGVAGAAARSPRRMASATRPSLHRQTLRGAPAGQRRAGLATPPACPKGSERPLYLYTRYTFAERAADLVSCMTLAEKIAQLHTIAPAIPRLGVQQYNYDSEGLHGIYRLGDDTNPGGRAGRHASATSFPSNFAATMSWDPPLMYAESTAISDEARGFLDKSLWGREPNNLGPARSDYGSLTYWAPTVNMDRDPRWGRTDEAFGEDPYLASQMADAYVDGYQGETMAGQPMTRFLKVAATAKHYALNNVEDNRMAISSNTDDANIRDYYTAQFRSLIENAHVAGLLTSYNAINGTPAVADTYTVNELAQSTYGFTGYTTSDCGAVGTTYQNPPSGHDWAPPGWTTNSGGANAVWTNTKTGQKISGAAGGQAYTVRAGTELNCKGTQYTPTNIQDAIKAGILDEGVLDAALTHVFTVRMETGEFNSPRYDPYTKITKSEIQSPAHQALAENVAANDLVLLQNGNVSGTSAPLLPADPAKLKKVVIVGNLAGTVTLGGYSGDPELQVNAVQGITAAVKAASPGASVVFDSCDTSTTATAPADCSATTMSDIKSASLVVVFVGTDENIAHEIPKNTAADGPDRTTLAMPGNYDSLISQVAALGNPKMALVIQSDGPVDIGNVQQDFPAIVFSGYNGESQGTALASVLFGGTDPSGHLDFTWYAGDSQLPPMQNYGLTPGQTGGLGRTYMYFTGTPTYPFGYGLSYTTFAYSNISADPTSVSADGTVNVSFTVTNTGSVPGATVAQLYVSTPFSVPGTELPAKRLEGFQRTNVLAPGQSQQITLTVPVPNLSFWDEQLLKEVVYDGPYQFGVGPDSADIVAAPQVQVTGAITPHVQYVTVQPDQVIFQPGQTLDLTGTNPWITPDTNPAMEQQHATADGIVEAVNNDQSFVDLSHATVSYSSSDPAVATVSPAGLLLATGPGVATISVTVNGVTGSAPIVVASPAGITPWSTRQASPAAAQASGAVDVLYKAADTTLGHQWYNPRSGWHGPVSMGSQVVNGEPSVITSVPNTIDAFWEGADGGLWHVYTTGRGWRSEQPMNLGTLGGPPKAVAQPDGIEDVFWRGTGDHLWYATFTPGSGWSAAGDLGGDLASDPAPTASLTGNFDVFWKGTDGDLWHVYQPPGGSWSAPVNLGMGPLGSAPAATGQLSGAIDVFWRGSSDDHLWHAYYVPGSGWQGPQDLGGDLPASADPVVPVSSVPGTVDVFWTGTDGNLWHTYTTAGHGWHAPSSLGMGPLGSMPFATAQPDGIEDVFWRGSSDDHLWHAYFRNGRWHGPQDLGGDLYPMP